MALKVFIAWNTFGGIILPTRKAMLGLRAKLAGASFRVLQRKCDSAHGSEYFNDPDGATQELADDGDLAVYFGHGSPGGIALSPAGSGTLTWRWGDGSVRHVLLVACSVFDEFHAGDWTNVFAGVRAVMGFSAVFWYDGDTGRRLGVALKEAPTLVDAWLTFAPASYGPSVLLAEESCLADTLLSPGVAITPDGDIAPVSNRSAFDHDRAADVAPDLQGRERRSSTGAAGRRRDGARRRGAVWRVATAQRLSGRLLRRVEQGLPVARALQIARTTATIEELDPGPARAVFDALEAAVAPPAAPMGAAPPAPLWPSTTRLRKPASEITVLVHGDLERTAEGVPLAGPGAVARLTFARDRSITALSFSGRALNLAERRTRVISRDQARRTIADRLSLDLGFIHDWRSGPPLALWLAAPERPMEFVIPFHAFEVATTSNGPRALVLTPAVELSLAEHRWVDPLRPHTTIVLP